MEGQSGAPLTLPLSPSVFEALAFFDEAAPPEVLQRHHDLLADVMAYGSKGEYQAFVQAFCLYPEDNAGGDSQCVPDQAVALYRSFAESDEPQDLLLVAPALRGLWRFASADALEIARNLLTSHDVRIHALAVAGVAAALEEQLVTLHEVRQKLDGLAILALERARRSI